MKLTIKGKTRRHKDLVSGADTYPPYASWISRTFMRLTILSSCKDEAHGDVELLMTKGEALALAEIIIKQARSIRDAEA